MSDYEKLEAIHSLLLEYLDNEGSCRDVLWEVLGIVEEARETYLKEHRENEEFLTQWAVLQSATGLTKH
jgi:hypothetical protein